MLFENSIRKLNCNFIKHFHITVFGNVYMEYCITIASFKNNKRHYNIFNLKTFHFKFYLKNILNGIL